MKVIASWSGGKDSCYAYYLAEQQGHQILSLFTMMMNEDKSNFHMIPKGIIEAQAVAMDVPIVKKATTPGTYEADFKALLLDFKAKGAEGIVTGDIQEVSGHEENWLGRICKEAGLTPIKPLWMLDTKQIYLDYLKTGFKATVVRTNRELSLDWLGRVLDRQFYDDILKLPGVDPCGEGGEYHTVITDGTNFKAKIVIEEAEKKRLDNGFGYLEIKKWKVIKK
ncbi:MAG TPA: diphthine--ammonia ligase [Candidatus Acidoferrales bacterium]|nr:diphthine--ammonia ligase [Candidatus Acidoferrales bacterium]